MDVRTGAPRTVAQADRGSALTNRAEPRWREHKIPKDTELRHRFETHIVCRLPCGARATFSLQLSMSAVRASSHFEIETHTGTEP